MEIIKGKIAQMPTHEVSQLRLAEILNLQQEVAELRDELQFRYQEIGRELTLGAHVERGPIHASLETYTDEHGKIGLRLAIR